MTVVIQRGKSVIVAFLKNSLFYSKNSLCLLSSIVDWRHWLTWACLGSVNKSPILVYRCVQVLRH